MVASGMIGVVDRLARACRLLPMCVGDVVVASGMMGVVDRWWAGWIAGGVQLGTLVPKACSNR